MQYIFIIIGLILAAIGVFGWLRGKKLENQTVEQIESKRKQQIFKDLSKYDFELTEFKMYAEQEKGRLQVEISQANLDRQDAIQRAAEAQEATNKILASEQGRAAAELQRFKELEQVKIEQENQKKIQSLNLLYDKQKQDLEKIFNEYKQMYSDELEEYETQVKEWKAKITAINEQIRHEEELQNSINCHRIQLSNSDKEDIQYLLSIEENIHNKQLLYKLIWSEYLQKPFNKMINDCFGARVPKNVIYCIEQIDLKKKYIGKTSAEVSKRWTDHIKNSLNIGTIKRQPIHEALYKNWDNFTFSILEEVKDEKLGDREKFYINFFQTDKYGFNIKSGG